MLLFQLIVYTGKFLHFLIRLNFNYPHLILDIEFHSIGSKVRKGTRVSNVTSTKNFEVQFSQNFNKQIYSETFFQK